MSAALKGQNEKRGIASYEMADLYASQVVDLEGGGPLKKKWNDTEWQVV